MKKNKLKINTRLITSLPYKFRNKFNIETCYSAAYSESQRKIVLPSTSSSEIFIFSLSLDLKVRNISKITLPKGTRPDIAIFKEENIIVGCRDTLEVIIINEELEVKPLFKPKNIFYPTCFKFSPAGKLFIGNLYGEPCILYKKKVIYLPIKCTQTYDCVWLSEQSLLISSTWENRVIYLREINNNWIVINSFPIIQPYRFSPVLKDKVLLTTRGWLDRPGKVHLLNISVFNNLNSKNIKPKTIPGLKKSFVVPDRLFFFKKNLSTKILSLFNLKRYTGYINDVAWINKDFFVITTKYGGKLIVFDLNGKIKGFKSRFFPSELTRFIDSRNPSKIHLFVDAHRSSIHEIEVKF